VGAQTQGPPQTGVAVVLARLHGAGGDRRLGAGRVDFKSRWELSSPAGPLGRRGQFKAGRWVVEVLRQVCDPLVRQSVHASRECRARAVGCGCTSRAAWACRGKGIGRAGGPHGAD